MNEWLDQPTEPGWYWVADGDVLTDIVMVTKLPKLFGGNGELCILTESGLPMYRNVAELTAYKWLRIEPPEVP